MSHDYRALLQTDGADSLLEVREYSRDRLVLEVTLDVLAGRRIRMVARHPRHLDLPPWVGLGGIEFGGAELLPADYLHRRNRGFDGDEPEMRVMRIVDDEDNVFFAIYHAPEVIEEP